MKFKTKEEIIKESVKLPNNFNRKSGLYFLLKDNEIVYVGKSDSIPYRICTHLKEGKKDFDSYSIIEIADKNMMGALEAYYIAVFKCKYNSIPGDKKFQKELLKLLLQEKSGEKEIFEKHIPTEKQLKHHNKMSDESREYWKEVSDEMNKQSYTLPNGDLIVKSMKTK